ncbi:hypothetical protein GPL15_25305 [Clostridium sp. MCC353]|uniref:hypothetical protein n=1 Tax=Clostridium sp. MCC353 TaxID=2592646 RepID=UPI001C0339FC|nr:hypothetical protein [Clostridium sp. MCC353]MBT9779792.1 hypothetical protein [Clostridium sp. MCC353]
MVWDFTLKGEGIFENTFTLYVKFAFNYFSQRKPAEKRDEGAEAGPGLETCGVGCALTAREVVWKPLVELSLQASKKTGRN